MNRTQTQLNFVCVLISYNWKELSETAQIFKEKTDKYHSTESWFGVLSQSKFRLLMCAVIIRIFKGKGQNVWVQWVIHQKLKIYSFKWSKHKKEWKWNFRSDHKEYKKIGMSSHPFRPPFLGVSSNFKS